MSRLDLRSVVVTAMLTLASLSQTGAAPPGASAGPVGRTVPSAPGGTGPIREAADLKELTSTVVIVDERLWIREAYSGSEVLGEVRNDGEGHVATVLVHLALYDNSDRLLETGTAVVRGSTFIRDPYAYGVQGLAPEEVGFFRIRFDTELETMDRVEHAIWGEEIQVSEPAARPEVVGEIEVADDGSGARLTAEVRNNGTAHAALISVAVAVKNADGELLDVTSGAVRGSVVGGLPNGLHVGEAADFGVHTTTAFEDVAEIDHKLRWYDVHEEIYRYAVAGIAHRPGVAGSTWRSNVAAVNLSGRPANLRLTLVSDVGEAVAATAVADGESVEYEDVVASLFGVEGDAAGALLVESDAPVTVTARTYNQGAAGTHGQHLPAVTAAQGVWRWDPSLIPLVKGGGGFRSNVGFVNLGDETVAVELDVYDRDGGLVATFTDIVVDPRAWRQVNGVVGDAVELGYAIVRVLGDGSVWAYASIIDAVSGDPQTVPVVAPSPPGGVVIFRPGR